MSGPVWSGLVRFGSGLGPVLGVLSVPPSTLPPKTLKVDRRRRP